MTSTLLATDQAVRHQAKFATNCKKSSMMIEHVDLSRRFELV